jgi:ferritin-like metal-binding protein YciE
MKENTEIRDIFIVGLRNAHAMENQALSIMRPQTKRIENYPEVARKLEEHIRETEGQMERLERLLESFGESTSTLKDTALSVRQPGCYGTCRSRRRNHQEQPRQFRLRELRDRRL